MRNITFDECNDAAEVCGLFNKVFANQEQLETKIVQNAQEIGALKPKKKGKSKMKSKGSASMRIVAILMLIVAIGSLCYAAYVPTDITYEIAANPESLSIYLRDVTNNMRSDSYVFTPRSAAPQSIEGRVYYDSDDFALLLYNGTSWQTIDAAGGMTLNSAYDFGGAGLGRTITATDGAVTIQNTEADSVPLLALSYTVGAQTGEGLTVTMASGSGNAIEIENTGTGKDFEGTSGLFTVDKDGNVVCVDLTTSDDVLFAGASYDVAFDDNRDLFIFQDNAILGLGGDHDGVADVTFIFDGTNLLIEAVSDNAGQIRLGSTNAMDWAHYGSTNSKIALWDASVPELLLTDYDIQFDDAADLIIGTDNDWVIESDTADTLEILTKLTDGTAAINLGVDGAGADLKMFSEVSGNYIEFDSTADEMYYEDCDLKLNDNAQIEFVWSDNGTDWTIDLATANRLTFTPTLTDDTAAFHIGTATNTSDLLVYMKAASETFLIDASEDSLTFVGDLALFTLTGTTKPFYVNVTGTVAGVATELKTTDGGIKFDAGGANNGDITLIAADIMTLTSADYKMFDGATTEVWRIDGTAAGSYHSISFTDATANIVWTFPDGGAGTVGVMSTSLATNFVDIANSVTGGSNEIIFEGSGANTEETIIRATNPTADIVWLLPDGGADTLAFMGSTLETNYPEVVNSVTGGSNQLIFEGTANTEETILQANDATGADAIIELPNDSGDIAYAPDGVVDYAAGAGALPITHVCITYQSSGGAEAITLPNGKPGQILHIVHDVDGGNGVLTPDTALGYTSIDLADLGDMVTFLYVDTQGWVIIGTAGNSAPPVVTP